MKIHCSSNVVLRVKASMGVQVVRFNRYPLRDF